MFDKLGTMMKLLGNQGKLQEEMQKFQAVVPTLTAEGTAGGGLVAVKVNGRLEVTAVRIADDALRLNDREVLEDLVAAATNQALAGVRAQLAAQTAKVAEGLGIPPAMLAGLPGMG